MASGRQTIEARRLSASHMRALALLSVALLLADSQGVKLVVADELQPAEHSRVIALESCVGFYEAPNALIVVTRNGDQLFVQWSGQIKMAQRFVKSSGQVKMPISPASASEYVFPGGDPKLAFTTDEKGQTRGLVLYPKAGEDLHAKRTADLPSNEIVRATLRCHSKRLGLVPIDPHPSYRPACVVVDDDRN
jgi:hypothetical protein